MRKVNPSIVIHAGAGPLLPNKESESRAHEGLKKIIQEAYQKLLHGEKSIDVVVWAVTQLEDNPQFNAGTGCMLQSDGVARMTASLMDGARGRFSGLMNIEEIQNPIQIAKLLQEEMDRVISGRGAKAYARRMGFPYYNPITEKSRAEWKAGTEGKKTGLETMVGTVGAVCVDQHGNVSAATSTGGKGMEIRGRVGDSATIAGNYASKSAAVSSTGIGEEIVESGLAVKIVTRVDDGMSLQQAFEKTFSELKEKHGRAGCIGVDSMGNINAKFTTPCMLHAFKTKDTEYIYPTTDKS